MKSSAVIDTGGILTFPKTIPTLRENSTPSYLLAVLVIQIASSIYLEGDWSSKLIKSSAFLLLVVDLRIAAELVKRIIALKEEWKHLQSRYDGSMQTLFSDVFYLSEKSKWCFVLSIPVIVGCYWMNPNLDQGLSKAHLIMAAGSIISSIFISEAIEVNNCPLNDSIMMNTVRKRGYDFGSSMAYSFFHGYLDIVLPNKGTEQKGLLENMQDYEAQNDVEFACNKLFVLIPLSCKCVVSLDDYKSIEKSQTLESVIKTRAGVQKRVYKNSVYKINMKNNRRVYVAVEYATPIRTMQDIIMHNNPHAGFYSKYKKEITLQFFITLREILKFTNMSDICELIYYDDEDGDVNPADVILSRLQLFKNRNR